MAPKRRRKTKAPRSKRSGPLAAWFKANPSVSLTAFGKTVDLSVQHVSNLLHGHTNPSREAAVAIEVATGGAVPVSAWS